MAENADFTFDQQSVDRISSVVRIVENMRSDLRPLSTGLRSPKNSPSVAACIVGGYDATKQRFPGRLVYEQGTTTTSTTTTPTGTTTSTTTTCPDAGTSTSTTYGPELCTKFPPMFELDMFEVQDCWVVMKPVDANRYVFGTLSRV